VAVRHFRQVQDPAPRRAVGVSQVVPTVRRPTMAMSSRSRGEGSALADMVTTTQARVGRLLTDPERPARAMLPGTGVPEGQVPLPRLQLLHATALRAAEVGTRSVNNYS
jgi:hypothetical protein